jgi:hypothetical protein
MAIASADSKAANERLDWLAKVFRRMTSGVATFKEFIQRNAGVSFVTFNFDSVIEDYLIQFVSRTFPREFSRDECVDAIPVIHVHGRLPPPPWKLRKPDSQNLGRDWELWIENAADTVRVIHEDLDTAEVKAGRAAVQHAELIMFMGMQYWPSNLERLGIGDGIPGVRSRHIFGTAMGLEPVDISRILRLLHPITLTNAKIDCAKALGVLPWLETHRGRAPQQGGQLLDE